MICFSLKDLRFLFAFTIIIPAHGIPGWYNKIAIDSRAISYSFARGSGLDAMYFVTAGLTSEFVSGNSAEYEIRLHMFNGARANTRKLLKVKMAASETLFPVIPTIAVHKNQILVVWQETLPEGNTAGIYYIYSENGPENFRPKQVLPASINNATAILPQAMADSAGYFYIIFQESTGANRYTLKSSMGKGGNFTSTSTIVRELQNLGRGVFFPSLVFRENRVDLFFQNRNEKNLKDDIYTVSSVNRGSSWSSPRRLTDNNFHDFSPQAIAGPEGLEWVWQSNEEKIWTIYTSGENTETRKITSSDTNSYLPVMAYSESAGRIFAWYDYKTSPPQIFSIFADMDNPKVSKAHQVTNERLSATNPQLVSWGSLTYLAYLSGGNLYIRQADTVAQKPLVQLKARKGLKNIGGSTFTALWKIPYEPSGVDQIAYSIDNKPETDPTIYNLNSAARQVSATGLKGGNYFFHLRYRDMIGNESDTVHTEFVVDETPPSAPVIESDTHKENMDTPVSKAKFKLTSSDDSSIRHYRYALGTKLNKRPNLRSETGEIVLENLADGDYVLSGQAVDISGRISDISAYTFGVGSPDLNTLQISHNVEGNTLGRKPVTFTLSDSSGRVPELFYYRVGRVAAEPYKGRKGVPMVKSDGFFSVALQISAETVSVISVGVLYSDGKRSKPRHFFFNQPGNEKFMSAKPAENLKPEKKSLPVKGVRTIITVSKKDAVYAFSFSLRGVNQAEVQGYIWNISKKAYEPSGEINSYGGPEYIYTLPPGKYFMNVGAIYGSGKNEKISYQQKEFTVERTIPRKILIFATGLFLSGVFVAIILVFFRKRLYYYWSKHYHERSNSQD